VVSSKGKPLPDVDETTIRVASAILEQAKEEMPNDKVLAAAVLGPDYTWTGILAAMHVVERTLPLTFSGPHRRQPFRGR